MCSSRCLNYFCNGTVPVCVSCGPRSLAFLEPARVRAYRTASRRYVLLSSPLVASWDSVLPQSACETPTRIVRLSLGLKSNRLSAVISFSPSHLATLRDCDILQRLISCIRPCVFDLFDHVKPFYNFAKDDMLSIQEWCWDCRNEEL